MKKIIALSGFLIFNIVLISQDSEISSIQDVEDLCLRIFTKYEQLFPTGCNTDEALDFHVYVFDDEGTTNKYMFLNQQYFIWHQDHGDMNLIFVGKCENTYCTIYRMSMGAYLDQMFLSPSLEKVLDAQVIMTRAEQKHELYTISDDILSLEKRYTANR